MNTLSTSIEVPLILLYKKGWKNANRKEAIPKTVFTTCS